VLKSFFSKLQNGGFYQDDVATTVIFSFGSHTAISQPILKCKPVVTSTMAPQLAQKLGLHFKIG
jgi:hypothetical protein